MPEINLNPPVLTQQQIDYFWSKVDKTPGHGPNGDCWIWTGALHHAGYGHMMIQIKYKRRTYRSNRLAYFLTHQIWSANCICHSCDNRACCNPAHLWEGSHAENLKDAARKNRLRKGDNHPARLNPELRQGERNGRAKVTITQVLEIRNLHAQGHTQKQIAAIYGISQVAVSKIILHKNWRHIP